MSGRDQDEESRLVRLQRVAENVLAAATVEELLKQVAIGARKLTGARFGAVARGHHDGRFDTGATSSAEGSAGALAAPVAGELYLALVEGRRGSMRTATSELKSSFAVGAMPSEVLAVQLGREDGEPEGMIVAADPQRSPLEGASETMLRHLATLTSFALRHLAARDEARLRAAEAEDGERILNALMDYIPEGIAIAEGPQVTIRKTSRYGQRMIGRHPDDLEAIPARDQGDRWNLLAPDGIPLDPRQLPLARAARRGELVTDEELSLQRPDGSVLPVSCNSGPILDRDGRIVGAVMAWRDITERKRAEDALMQANRRKDEFLALLAHELRNPLAPLVNASQILRRGAADEAVWAEAVEVIERQVWHMVRLIDDLLDVARITRGAIRLQRARVDLALIVESGVVASRPLIEERKHRLSVSCPESSITLHADATRLTQVIANLLNNAAKYTPTGGEVQLVVERAGPTALVRVRDSGVGIPEEARPRLFEMFSRVGSSDGTKEGLGVGLALARELVAMHGGTISVHSEGVGKGSEFVVRLPTVPPADEGSAPRRAPAAELDASADEGLRVLVVDDNPDAARSLSTLLELLGHRVVVAHDGVRALEIAADEPPEVAVLDIGLPGIDGYQLARTLRERFPANELLLVAVTGWGQQRDRRRSLEAGFDHHLVKPAKPDELSRILARFRECAHRAGSS